MAALNQVGNRSATFDAARKHPRALVQGAAAFARLREKRARVVPPEEMAAIASTVVVSPYVDVPQWWLEEQASDAAPGEHWEEARIELDRRESLALKEKYAPIAAEQSARAEAWNKERLS